MARERYENIWLLSTQLLSLFLEQCLVLSLYQVFQMTIKTLMDIWISVIQVVITKDENTLSKNTVHLFSLLSIAWGLLSAFFLFLS